jgi:hypothetical protein
MLRTICGRDKESRKLKAENGGVEMHFRFGARRCVSLPIAADFIAQVTNYEAERNFAIV